MIFSTKKQHTGGKNFQHLPGFPRPSPLLTEAHTPRKIVNIVNKSGKGLVKQHEFVDGKGFFIVNNNGCIVNRMRGPRRQAAAVTLLFAGTRLPPCPRGRAFLGTKNRAATYTVSQKGTRRRKSRSFLFCCTAREGRETFPYTIKVPFLGKRPVQRVL